MVLKNKSALWWIVILNVIFFVFEIVLLFINPDYIKYFALNAENIFSGKYLWTLIFHMFSHGGFLHLIVNMIALVSLGGLCERIIGRKRFIWFYLISGLFAGLLSIMLAEFFGFGFWERVFGSREVYMLGASGAIFGIAGLFVVLLPKLRFGILFIPFFTLPAYVMVPLFLVVIWIITIISGIGIGNSAHFGGFLAGLIYGFYLRAKYKQKIKLLQRTFR
ncbi:MAG: rhomboid family intramembrane serine protease [Candidatus Pacearchaeota archaeon]|nr:rhomboid family intramembrane serine protease [Candidatus Pacearchaeota archaeon]